MYKFAIAVPEVKVSGLSGCVRVNFRLTGQKKVKHFGLMGEFVRLVRQIFYCFTCARTREGLKGCCQLVKNALGYFYFSGQAGQIKEIGEIVNKIMSGLCFFARTQPDTAGQGTPI